MPQAPDISMKSKRRIDLNIVFRCFIEAGVPAKDIVYDRANDRVFVKDQESTQKLTHEGSRANWETAIAEVK